MTKGQPKRSARPGVDFAGRTPLHIAAIESDVAAVQRLLADGADPSAADDNGWTALHFAAQSNSADLAMLLLQSGASVDARDSHGNTPLFRAVFSSLGNGEVIKLLRNRGADSFAENAHGISPLKLARTIANFDVRQFFDDLPGNTND